MDRLIPGPTDTGMHSGGQDPASVYPHARLVARLPPGGPNGRIFWNSEKYPIFTRFNDKPVAAKPSGSESEARDLKAQVAQVRERYPLQWLR